MLWLKSLTNCPPGEFYYKQAEAGSHVFGPSPLIGQVAALVSDFRRGNSLPRSDQMSCMVDVIQFTVARLDPRSEWIIETDLDTGALLPGVGGGGGCAGCGAVVS
jgi:hypothetical protein